MRNERKCDVTFFCCCFFCYSVVWQTVFTFFLRSLQENGKFINQFPNENCLTCKDLLAVVCQGATSPEADTEDDLLRRGPEWLPVTFNLTLELPLFVDHYLKRKKR